VIDFNGFGEMFRYIFQISVGIENKWRFYKLFRSRDMGRSVAVRRWTTTALECYKRGCNCEGCFYRDFFSGSSQKCQMKASVLELVRVIGTPDVELPQFLADE
jgi:hypothetical protein